MKRLDRVTAKLQSVVAPILFIHKCICTNTCMMLLFTPILLCASLVLGQIREVVSPAHCLEGIVWRRSDIIRVMDRLNATRSYGYYKRLRVCWLRPSEPRVEHCEVPGAEEVVTFLCRSTTSGRIHWSPFEETERVEQVKHVSNAPTRPSEQTEHQSTATTHAPVAEV